MDHSPPGFSCHEIFQSRILWVAISFSRRSSWPRDRTCGSCHVSCIAGRIFTAEPLGKPAQLGHGNSTAVLFSCMDICFSVYQTQSHRKFSMGLSETTWGNLNSIQSDVDPKQVEHFPLVCFCRLEEHQPIFSKNPACSLCCREKENRIMNARGLSPCSKNRLVPA